MARNTLSPKDGAKYNAIKSKLKKGKQKPGNADPKAFKNFKKKAAELERKQKDRRRTALDKLFKRNEKLLKMITQIKGNSKLQDEQRRNLLEKILKEMLKTYQLTPALKSALSKDQFEKEIRKAIGTLPDDDRNAANGHLDALLRQMKKEGEETKQMLQDAARVLNHHNKNIDAGGAADFTIILIALLALCMKFKDWSKKLK
ncbi:MAG: hypothetical protein O7G85_06450 [Planctomycetota bacterium]|nr:hypothetical protein [Planctomycetota bacterium]